jgi:hypothetical protein
MARADDLSPEPYGALRWVLGNPDGVSRDEAEWGWVQSGVQRPHTLRVADGSTEGQPYLLLSRE